MFMSRKKHIALLISLLFLWLPMTAWSAAGKAIFVLGKVIAVDKSGMELRIRRGDELNSGDTIVTNASSQIQIRMDDGSLLAVRPNSRFSIDDYVFQDDIDTDLSHYTLIKGTIRSITGTIGKRNKSAFGLNTLVGTIGIRGTDFTARLCNADCGSSEDGLYVGVMQGAVVMENDGGELKVLPGEFGYIQDQSMEPSQLETSPGDLLFAQATDKPQTNTADASEESNTVTTTETVASTTDSTTHPGRQRCGKRY